MALLAHRELKKIRLLSFRFPLVPFQEVVIVVRLLHAKKDDGLLGSWEGKILAEEEGERGSRVAEMIEGDRGWGRWGAKFNC